MGKNNITFSVAFIFNIISALRKKKLRPVSVFVFLMTQKHRVSEELVAYMAEKKRDLEPEVLRDAGTCQGRAAEKGRNLIMTNFWTRSCIPCTMLPLSKSMEIFQGKILLLRLDRVIKSN